MSRASAVKSLVTRVLTSPRTRDLRRLLAETGRRLGGGPHRVLYFHQVDDPYSQLAAQVLPGLLERYDVELVPMLVGPAPSWAAPERERLIAYSRKDAADIAPYLGLDFEDPGRQPEDDLVELTNRTLASLHDAAGFARVAAQAGRALWGRERADLEAIAKEHEPAPPADSTSLLVANDERRRALGHYLSATFRYGGEWYWGVDRLHHLERRLVGLDARRPGAPAGGLLERSSSPALARVAPGRRVALEFFPSLRSPYTYVAMSRLYQLAERYPVDLVLRPVLPMVMRGLPVPAAKRLYIVLDTKREAMDAGVAFGKIADPVGRAVERGLSLFAWARQQGRAAEYLLCFCRAAFAEGVDAASDAGLRHVVEGAGLSWAEAGGELDNDDWRGEMEANREAMFEMGLWGVPSFRLLGDGGQSDFCTWGQDRLWLLEEEIKQRLR